MNVEENLYFLKHINSVDNTVSPWATTAIVIGIPIAAVMHNNMWLYHLTMAITEVPVI